MRGKFAEWAGPRCVGNSAVAVYFGDERITLLLLSADMSLSFREFNLLILHYTHVFFLRYQILN